MTKTEIELVKILVRVTNDKAFKIPLIGKRKLKTALEMKRNGLLDVETHEKFKDCFYVKPFDSVIHIKA